jgi:Uma2 family endonuclease
MQHHLQAPPRTAMEVYKMLPEGTLAEVIDGSLYMSPAPNTNHQKIVRSLFLKMFDYTASNHLGETFFAPHDVFLDEISNAVQPDIIFIASRNLSILKDDAIHGVPDLLVEVLSPGNVEHDTIKKKSTYEKFGVQEYWIVNPDTKEAIGYTQSNKLYVECGRFTGKIVSLLLKQQFEF